MNMLPLSDDVIEELAEARFTNRELSWLDFNSRVLAQAEDPQLPVLERLKFCAIFSSNLDEFFMVRVAGLRDQVAGGVNKSGPDGMSPQAQLGAIRSEVDRQLERLDAVLVANILPELTSEAINVVGWQDLTVDERKFATDEFEDRIFPVLTPLAVDPGHPFPYISNLSVSIAVLINDPATELHRFARVKVPASMPRLLTLPGDNRFVPLEAVMVAHLDELFPGMDVIGGWPFRVTRNSDLTLDSDADDLLEAVEVELRRRRFGQAIRLEVTDDIPDEAFQLLLRELELEIDSVYSQTTLIDPSCYWELVGLDRPDLKASSRPRVVPRRLRDLEGSRDFFDRIRREDLLIHHPYESFQASITEFVRQSSVDPDVLAMKITLYRTSGDSPIIEALIGAAERGKQVAVLIELKARFDEQANIEWARRLENAGVHVVYGWVGLKIHSKIMLVVRRESNGITRYCHVGTGNYNPKTARLYEDVGLLTANADVGADVTQLFNFLTGYGRDVAYQRLAVAPTHMRNRLVQMIENEIAADSPDRHIVMKMNSLVDPQLIDMLYEASRAGVQVDLIVRGICCLRPQVPGLSETIHVRSILGRYLEHSRIYYFANGAIVDESVDLDPEQKDRFYIGSADLMPRNLDRRVEVLVQVDAPEAKRRLSEILVTCLDDTALSWVLEADGTYRRLGHLGDGINAHEVLEELAAARSSGGDPTLDLEMRPRTLSAGSLNAYGDRLGDL